MSCRLAAILLAGLTLTGSGAGKATTMMKERQSLRSRELRPARNGDIAVREELDEARRAGTLAAYDLFLARHPEHRLAEVARRERTEIAARGAK